MRSRLIPPLVCALLVALAPARARADRSMPGLGEAIVEALNSMNFYSQLQLGAGGVLASETHPGGTELRATANLAGLGGSLGGRYEPYPSGGHGGLGFVDLQLRPLPLFKSNFYRVLDPFVSVGGELGSGTHGLHAAQTLGVGLDIGVFSAFSRSGEDIHPAINLLYQLRTVQTQSELPSRLLHLGVAFRTVFLAAHPGPPPSPPCAAGRGVRRGIVGARRQAAGGWRLAAGGSRLAAGGSRLTPRGSCLAGPRRARWEHAPHRARFHRLTPFGPLPLRRRGRMGGVSADPSPSDPASGVAQESIFDASRSRSTRYPMTA